MPFALYPSSLAILTMFSQYCDWLNMDSDAAWFNWYDRVWYMVATRSTSMDMFDPGYTWSLVEGSSMSLLIIRSLIWQALKVAYFTGKSYASETLSFEKRFSSLYFVLITLMVFPEIVSFTIYHFNYAKKSEISSQNGYSFSIFFRKYMQYQERKLEI